MPARTGHIPKLRVAGPNPVSRSSRSKGFRREAEPLGVFGQGRGQGSCGSGHQGTAAMAESAPFEPSDHAVVVGPTAVSLRAELGDVAAPQVTAHLIHWDEINRDETPRLELERARRGATAASLGSRMSHCSSEPGEAPRPALPPDTGAAAALLASCVAGPLRRQWDRDGSKLSRSASAARGHTAESRSPRSGQGPRQGRRGREP